VKLTCGLWSDSRDWTARKIERDQLDYMNDVMRSGAERAVVIRLSQRMAMGNLNHAGHKDQRNAENSEQ